MSLGILPVFNPPLRSVKFETDGCRLFRFFERLDRVAVRQGLPLMSSFGDNRPVPEGFDGDPEELEEIQGPWAEWFSASEGLAMASGLRSALQEDKTILGGLSDAESVLSELAALEVVLQAAVKAGAQFRFEVVS
jgi:hypothetical protein